MKLYKIHPEFKPRPWGRRNLTPLFSMPLGVDDPIGEVWLTALGCLASAAGEETQKKPLAEVWAGLSATERGTAWAGTGRFPLLLKFVFTADRLSVQVHPDDRFAREHEGEPWGKTEAWHVLAADPLSWVKVGLKPGIGREKLDEQWGTAAIDEALNRVRVDAGDTLYIPAGTLHSIGPGLCLFEVQQYSDLTYRVYDYGRPGLDGRPRELHLEQARAAVHATSADRGRVQQPTIHFHKGNAVAVLVDSPYFRVEKFRTEGNLQLDGDPDRFSLLVFFEGHGRLLGENCEVGFVRGSTFLLPAGIPGAVVEPSEPSVLVRVWPQHL